MPSLPVVSDELTSRVEDELVLLCSQTKVDAETSARVKAITSFPNKVDWDYVYQLARRHSVLPLIYSQLSTAAPANVPPDQLARLKEDYQNNVARNLLLTAELCQILQTFEAAGIEAVPYKGPALAVYAYGNLALRRFVDLDILVRKADTLLAKEVLRARGFVCGTPWTNTQQALLLRTQHNLSLSREEGRMVVELVQFICVLVAGRKFLGTLGDHASQRCGSEEFVGRGSVAIALCARFQASLGTTGLDLRCG